MLSFVFSLALMICTGLLVYMLGSADPLNWLLIPPVIALCFFLFLGRLPRPHHWRPQSPVKRYRAAEDF